MKRELFELIDREKKEAERLARLAEKELKKLPMGRLEVRTVRKKYIQYTGIIEDNGKTVKRYIRKKNIRLAQQLAQREYDTKLVRAVEQLSKALSEVIEVLECCDPEQIYLRETEARRALITPAIPSDEQFIAEWYGDHPGSSNSYEMATTYTTLRGEKVRSKSEKMIADAYYAAEIPYVYEPSLHLRSGKTLYPDFAVLNVAKRRTLYHEHFGLMDDDDYRSSCIRKMRKYNDSGFWSGNTMIYTFEGEDAPFDQDELERIIEEYLR
ncbi:MAG: hypothetical protein J6U10_09175 [Lachnospiraceae bacterium]|nr:hypothetical protein [Lachnospiraceae bacterium]